MLRAIHEIRPGWIVGENVGGILTMVQPGKAAHVGCQPSLFGEDQPVYRKREEYVVETICRDLEREGYTVQPLLIPACAVGAPHRRDRVWFVAHANGEGLQPEGTELSPEGSSGNHPRDVAAHPDSDGDTPLAASGTLETSGARVDARDGEREKNPNGLTDFLDFHGLLPTPTARDWKGAPTLEHFARKGKNPQQGSLPDFFAQAGRSFQLNPLFVAEMMGFPVNWTVLPFLPGGSSPSRDTGTPSSPR